MKMLTMAALLSFSFGAMADLEECPAAKSLSESMIHESVQKEFGTNYKINFYTDATMTKEYSDKAKCISETLYVLEAMDSKSGINRTYMGKLVIDAKGNTQAEPVLVQAGVL